MLLLLGLLVQPHLLITMLPLARLLAVWAVLPAPTFPWRDRLIGSGCGLRAAVPLALAVSMTEELQHLRGITPAMAEPLAAQLLALLFVVVLSDLLLQTMLMRRLLPLMQATLPGASGAE